MKWYLFCFLIFNVHLTFAQQFSKTIPIKGGKFIQIDDAGNVYVAKKDRTIVKYSEVGDSVGYYNNISFGNLYSIDANNPLLLLLYYNSFNQLIVLDRLMNEKNTIDLKQLQLFQVNAIGLSYDNQILVYDVMNAKLKKLDENLSTLLESNDMRQELDKVIQPIQIIDKDSLIYLVSKNLGVHVFNRMLNYLYFIPIDNISNVQKIGTQLIYYSNNNFYKFDILNYKKEIIPIQSPIDTKYLDVKIGRNRIYCLSKDQLFIVDY